MTDQAIRDIFTAFYDKKDASASKRQASATLNATPDPESATMGLQLGAELGVPPRAVMGAPELFQSRAAQNRASSALSSAPSIAEWLGQDPINGGISRDDLDNLTWFERNLGAPGRALGRGVRRISAAPDTFKAVSSARSAEDVGRSYDEILRDELARYGGVPLDQLPAATQVALTQIAQRRFERVSGDDASDREEYIRQGAEALMRAQEILRVANEIPMSQTAADFRDRDLSRAENSLMGTLGAFVKNPVGGAAFIAETAAESLPVMALATVTTAATRSPGAGALVMGAGSFATEATVEINQFIQEQGIDLSTPEAAAAALANPDIMRAAAERGATRGFVISIFDAVSGGIAGQRLAQTPGGEVVAQGIAQIVLGSGGEAAGQAAVGDSLDWRDIVVEGLAELATAPIEVAGVGGRGLARLFRGRLTSGDTAARIDEIDQMAAQSKVRERSPDKFLEALEAAGQGDQLLFVPAEGLQEYFQSRGIDAFDETLEDWGVDVSTYREQLLSGGDVAVPTSRYAAYISGTEDATWFRDNASMDPDEMSVAEAAEFNARVSEIAQEEFERAEQRQRDDLDSRASDVQIYDQVFSQLRSAGRSPDVAQREASVWSAFWRTMGERYGEDPLDLARSMGVNIVGPEDQLARRRGDVDFRLNALRSNATRALAPSGQSVIDFVQELGGVRDDGGDIEAMDAPRGLIAETRAEIIERQSQPSLSGLPGEGKGRGLDEIGRAMIDAGYITQDQITAEMDEAALALDAISRALSGEDVYPVGQGRDPENVRLSEALARAGVDLSTATNDEAIAALEGVEYGQDGRLITDSPEFRAWFGDSKVVDEDGDPLVVYHGTRSEFDAFDGLTWLSEEREMAEDYATLLRRGETYEDSTPRVIEAYARIERPFDTDIGLPRVLPFREFAVEAMDQAADRMTPDIADAVQDVIARAEQISTANHGKEAYWNDDFQPLTIELLELLGFDGLIFREESALNASDADEDTAVTYAALRSNQVKSVNNRGTFDPADPRILFQSAPVDPDAFVRWAGTDNPILDPSEVNDADFSGPGPFVMRAFHGTTHDFEAFDASQRGNKEGQFGAVNYFTTSEGDASGNYGSDGPDLTGRIEVAAERLFDEISDDPEAYGLSDDADSDVIEAKAVDIATSNLRGGDEKVLEVFIRSERPFVVGADDSPFVEFVDFDALERQAIERVADEEGLSVEEIEAARDDYDDQIQEVRWEIEDESENPLLAAISSVADRYELDAAEIFEAVSEFSTEGGRQSNLEQALRASETLAYAEGPEDGGLIGYHALAEIIQELGFDSIILKNADDRFPNMDINPGTAHIHVFDANNSNIKSVENQGSFDRTDPRILYQSGSLTREEVDDFAKSVKEDLGLRDLSIFLSGENLKLNMIAVDKDKHGQGAGSEAMRRIVDFADQHGKTVALTPGLPDDGFGTTSRARLVKFYKRFGFVENKGRNKDFTISEGMYREPQRTLNQGKGDKRGSIQLPRGGLREGETVINLFEAADLSTFLHESGHFFLEAFTALASDENAPQAMRDDMAAIRKFLGVEDDQPFTVDQHETWARGFEAYLLEGKAPSLDLMDAFARFKAWLTRIYRSAAGLDVKITPEIREVMDRMLATDVEIQAVRDDLQMRPLFTDAGAAGMSDADFAAYQRVARRGVEQAEASLLRRTMEKVRRETQAWFKAERKAVTERVTDQVNREPVYRAIDLMANRAWLTDTDKEVPDIQLNRAQLVERFGDGVLAEISRKRIGGKRSIYVKDGMDIDAAAELFGFASASQMIDAIQNAPRKKEYIRQEVEAELLKMHGDPLNDGSIEEAAAQAVHSQQQRQSQVTEARVLAARQGRPTRDIKAKVYKARARRMFGAMSVREAARPAAFLAAERKAARDAQRAFARVARETGAAEEALAMALEAKERQILNGFLHDEAVDFSKRLDAQRQKMRDYDKKKVREKLQGGYIEQIDAILARFDFRVRSNRQVERSESLREFMDRMISEGREAELSIDPRLEDEARRTHYSRLSVDEINGLFDTISNLDHIGRYKQRLIDAKEARDLRAVADSVAANVLANSKGAGPNRTPTASETRRKTGRDYLNLTLNADTLLREVDGFEDFGAAWVNLKQSVDAGMARLTERRLKMAKDFDAIYNRYSASEQRQMAKKVRNDSLGGDFSKWDIIAIALNTGNADNYQRLTNPDTKGSFSPEQVDMALASLDARDWETVQMILDLINGFWPEISEKQKRITGVTLQKVEPQVMTSAAPASFRGGYYPIKYDSRLSGQVSDLDMKDLADSLIGGRFGKAQTKNGHTKERAASTKLPLMLDLSVAHSHVSQVLYDLEIGEPVANSWKILHQPQVRDAFKDRGKSSDYEALEIWLQDVASGDQVAARGMERYLRHLRSGFVVSRLAINISTALIQPSGLVQSAVVIGKRAVAKGTVDYIANRSRWLREVREVSPLMRERATTFERDIFNIVGDLEGGPVSGPVAKFHRDVVMPWSFALMQAVQFHAVDMPTWVSAYQAEIEKSGDEAKALTYADSMVRRAQGSGLMSDRGMLERGTLSADSRQREFPRLLTALGSYMFAKGNVAYEATMKTNFKSPVQAMNWAFDIVLLFTLEAVLYSAVKGYLPGEDEDPAGWLLTETLYGVMSTQPILREVSGALQGFGGGGILGAIIEKSVARPAQQIGQGEADKALMKSLIDAAGIWLHLPSSQVNATLDAILDDDLSLNPDFDVLGATGIGSGGQSAIEWIMEK